MYRSLAAAGALVVFAAGSANAQMGQMPKPEGKEVTITGHVIDVSCKFGQGLSGEAMHRVCSQVCGDKGLPLAILTDDGKLYIPTTPQMPGEGQNKKLREFAEQEVTVTGTAFAAGGATAIQIAKITKKA